MPKVLALDIETVPDNQRRLPLLFSVPLDCPMRLTATRQDLPSSSHLPSLRVDDGLETEVAFPTAPNMMDLPLIPILCPFGGN